MDATTREPTDAAPDEGPAHSAAYWLRALIEAARGKKRPLVHLQHNPDPDALASGVAVKFILKRLLGTATVLSHTGQVGRAENRAMLRWLGIRIIPSFKINYDEHDLVVVVDTHPGSGTCRLPHGVVPQVVVDHHPTASVPAEVEVPFVDPSFGSTSTMVGWLMIENGIRPDAQVATALAYGIKTDTLDLARSIGPHDEGVYREIYALADKRLLGRIQRARLSQEYFRLLERGLRRGKVTDFAITTYLGDVDHPDAVAEMADILFRLEGMKWAMVGGSNGPLMYLSIRAIQAEGVNAGKVAEEITGGFGGGHETFAGAQVPLPTDGSTPNEFFETLWERFVGSIRAKKSLSRPLTVPASVMTPEDVSKEKSRNGDRLKNGKKKT